MREAIRETERKRDAVTRRKEGTERNDLISVSQCDGR